MFSGSNNVILGGSFQYIPSQDLPSTVAFERLLQAASPSAFHNSGDRFNPPKCHPKTRLKVLEKIGNWVDGNEHPNESVMWVNGGAGVGKSAIAQTLAERLAEEKRLVASFFFSRTDPSRNNANRLVPTLAYHTLLHIPNLKEPIIHAIVRNPLVFELSIDAQFLALLIEPICELAESGYFQCSRSPRVIIIDGLDECIGPTAQINILNAISNASKTAHFPLLFLLASRPEHHLSIAFTSKSLLGLLTCLSLDDSFSPENDIRIFLDDQFEELKESHPFRAHLPRTWPDPLDIQTLVWKSSSQFIYASTAMKYISSSRHRPQHRLKAILGLYPLQNENPFFELDALYTHILLSLEAEHLGRVQDILAYHLFVLNSHLRTLAEIEAFLSLEAGDIQIALCDLASVVRLAEDPTTTQGIKVLHASFSNFLQDQSRSQSFYIDPQLRCAALAERYLEILRIPDFKLPHSWFADIPHLLRDAAVTAGIQQNFLKFSLLDVSRNWYDGRGDMDKTGFSRFMNASLFVVKKRNLGFDHLTTIFDEYLLAYVGNYYCDPHHIFLLALSGIGARYTRYSYKANPEYPGQVQVDIYHLFDESRPLDTVNLCLFQSLTNHEAIKQSHYMRHLQTFLNNPSRSREHVLNRQRYAIAAFHCLKMLCDENLLIPPRDHNRREHRMRRDRPWIFRKFFRPNARALRRYKRNFSKKETWNDAHLSKFASLLEETSDYCQSRIFRWLLRCFRRLLKRSGSSKELLDLASRCSFASRSQDWPRKAKLTRNAMKMYLDFCKSQGGTVPKENFWDKIRRLEFRL